MLCSVPYFVDRTRFQHGVLCYVKATITGRRVSEGGTHEEMLRPQDQERENRQ